MRKKIIQETSTFTSDEILACGKAILRTEIDAVDRALTMLGEDFANAVRLIAQCDGTLILTGMGKAGHVARKIAATFSSTGTRALYLHPAEAVHGDLGVVARHDVIIAISNSGETTELVRILPHIKEIGAKLISLTGDPDSELARNSECIIDCGVEAEACPLGLAPTASTTVALAVGDALAMVVLEMKGFSSDDYGFFHPGGSLGRQLMKVKDAMRTGQHNAIISESATVKEALAATTKAEGGAILVVNQTGQLTGIFTDGDLRRSLLRNPNLLELSVGDVMIKSPRTIAPDQLAADAAAICKQLKINDLPVVDENEKPLGLFNLKDLMEW